MGTKIGEMLKHNHFIDFLYFLGKRAKADAVFRVASALAYTSLIAIVPLIAIAIAIFSAFPVFDGIKEQLADFLFQNLTADFEEHIRENLSEIVKNSGQLGAVGVSGIAITAIMLLSTIEDECGAHVTVLGRGPTTADWTER